MWFQMFSVTPTDLDPNSDPDPSKTLSACLPVRHASQIRDGVSQRDMVHPQEVLQVLQLGGSSDLLQALDLHQLTAALAFLLLLQRLLR